MRSPFVKVPHLSMPTDRSGRGAMGVLIAGTASVVLWAGILGIARILF